MSRIADPIERRRAKRAQSHQFTLIVAGAITAAVFALFGVVGVVILVVSGGPKNAAIAAGAAEPRADKEGLEWSESDLFNHLKRKGVVVRMEETGGTPFESGKAYIFVTSDGTKIYVKKQLGETDANTRANGLGKGKSLAWGRFFLWPDTPELLNACRVALQSK